MLASWWLFSFIPLQELMCTFLSFEYGEWNVASVFLIHFAPPGSKFLSWSFQYDAIYVKLVPAYIPYVNKVFL